jgi:hypothetical protein
MSKTHVCLVSFLIVVSVCLLVPVYSQTTPLEVEVNGEKMDFADVQPYIDERTGSTMVPARELAEKLGAGVQWDGLLKQVTFHLQRSTVVVTIDRYDASVSGKSARLDAPAVIKNDRTMVPLRLISEGLGAEVVWAEDRQVVHVTSPDKLQRATWVWDSTIIENDPGGLLQFAADQRLTSIYIRYDTNASREAYRTFIRSANDLGMKVEALAGTSYWIYETNHIHIQRFITAVTQYNASVEAMERFKGFHFDIEPYTLDIWKTDQTWVLERWMDTVKLIEREVRNADPGMTMAFDIPFWINGYPVPGTSYPFSSWLLEKADGVVIMAYRNTALGSNGIIARAKPIILEAATLKKPAVIAVDTVPSKEGDHISFYALNPAVMEIQLRMVKESLTPYSSYSGVAVHDYVRWRELLENSEGG